MSIFLPEMFKLKIIFRMTDASRVIATDDQAALSKTSCVRLGYWEDEALLKVEFIITFYLINLFSSSQKRSEGRR